MRTVAAFVAVALTLAPTPAAAHTETELDTWKADWNTRVVEAGALTPALVAEWNDMAVRHWRRPHIDPPRRAVAWSGTVEQWRPLVETYFLPADVPWAMRVMACESGGNPLAKNPNSSASGLFQHLARYWDARSAKAGWAGASIWDPEANIAVAAWLYYNSGPQHWTCK